MTTLKIIFLVLLCIPFLYLAITLISKSIDDVLSGKTKKSK